MLAILAFLGDALFDVFPNSLRFNFILIMLSILIANVVHERRTALNRVEKGGAKQLENLEQLEGKLKSLDSNLETLRVVVDSSLKGLGTDVGFIKAATAEVAVLRTKESYKGDAALVGDAQEALWISGLMLQSTVDQLRTMLERARGGLHFRLLTISPEETVVKETAAYIGVDAVWLSRKLESNLDDLHNRLQNDPMTEGRVEIRTMCHRPALGFYISDPARLDGYMTVMPYFFDFKDDRKPPVLHLTRNTDSEIRTFELYLQEFEAMWNQAQPWPPA